VASLTLLQIASRLPNGYPDTQDLVGDPIQELNAGTGERDVRTKSPDGLQQQAFQGARLQFRSVCRPAAGETFKDFPLTDLETGEPVKLSDFLGKWVVLETGSATCSMYTKDIADMKALEAEFPDVEFVLIYVREAHPGERLGPRQSMDEKRAAARLLKPRYGEHRRILVDNLDGDFHRAYGGMPDVVYVMRPDGTIHYRCNWATPQGVRAALSDRENFHRVENADMAAIKASRGKYNMVRTMWTGGFVALYDFAKNAPLTIAKHAKVDAYYKKHGRFKN